MVLLTFSSGARKIMVLKSSWCVSYLRKSPIGKGVKEARCLGSDCDTTQLRDYS